MSSFYRDIAQTMESIYDNIKREPLEDLSKEELIKLLRSVQEDAKESYVSYSVNMGWYSNSEEAEKELDGIEEDEQQDLEQDFLSYPLYRFELTDWMAKQKRFSENEIVGHLVEERDKACFIFVTKPIQNQFSIPIWLPKSQIVNKEEIPFIET